MKNTPDEIIEIVTAYKAGKRIERHWLMGTEWISVKNPEWAFTEYAYRVAPEPKLRPWRPEEVPVGAIARQKANHNNRTIIAAVIDGNAYAGRPDVVRADEWQLFEKCEHSTDGGKTWKPCGVEE